MALPRKLKYLNMFNDGLSYMGVVESVTLPKLTRKLEKYRGGGMPGSVSIDLGLDDDALSLEWTLGGLPDVALWAQYASPGADSVPLRFTGSFQRDDTGAISAVEVVMRGRHKEYDGGENKQGESGTTKIATECSYYQLTIDGKEVIEIDVVNMVMKVDGVDRLAEHRRAIGLYPLDRSARLAGHLLTFKESNIMENINETATTETENSNIVILDNPVLRGEQKIEQVTVTKPNAGTLRGVSLASLANSDVDALIKVLPRMTYPALTEHEVMRLEASDLILFAGKVVGFLSPSSAR